MQNLITQATDSFLSSFVIKSKEMMLEFLLSLIEMINTHLMNLFETPIIRDFVSMGTTIGRFLFAATLIILLIDIVEEAGSMKNDQFKAIEWPTIFFNMVKAVVFIEAAPQLSIIALRMISISVGEFDPSPYLNSIINMDINMFGMAIAIIAVGGFTLLTILRFGAILIQAFSVFLYVPDIVRGHTTSMGTWIRQTVAILLTYFLQYVLFFIGLVSYFNTETITAYLLWLTMLYVSKYLDKFGMSSGIKGVVSSGVSVAQSAKSAMTLLGG